MLTKFFLRNTTDGGKFKLYIRLRPSSDKEIKVSVPADPISPETWLAYNGNAEGLPQEIQDRIGEMSDRVRKGIMSKNEDLFDRLDAVKRAVTSACGADPSISKEEVKEIVNAAYFAKERAKQAEDDKRREAEEAEKNRLTFTRFFRQVLDELEADAKEQREAEAEGRDAGFKHPKIKAERTRLNYKYAFDLLCDFRKDVGFDEVDEVFCNQFRVFLTKKGMSAGTIVQVFSVIMRVMKMAGKKKYDNGQRYTTNDIYNRDKEDYGLESQDVGENAIALTMSELEAIRQVDLSDLADGFDLARNLFLISCFTGQRYSDVSTITEDHFIRDEAGDLYVCFEQKKTHRKVTILVASALRPIFEKYAYNLPYLSEPQMNANLKVIAKRAGLTQTEPGMTARKNKENPHGKKNPARWELVSSHTGRRTAATLLLKEGRTFEEIRSITGHKTDENLMKYLKLTKVEVMERQKKFGLLQ